MKSNMIPLILWQEGDRILCMKSARTMRCNIYMMERTTILSQMKLYKRAKLSTTTQTCSTCRANVKVNATSYFTMWQLVWPYTFNITTKNLKDSASTTYAPQQSKNPKNLSTMQYHCKFDAFFIKWRIGITSMCDTNFIWELLLSSPGISGSPAYFWCIVILWDSCN